MSDKIKAPRAVGRPRKFDEAAVLQQATQLFWREGFEGLSYEKLGKDLGLSKPSLYNSFGDKAALFERVLGEYAQGATAAIVESVADKETVAEAARAMLLGGAAFYTQPTGHSLGCLLIGTSLPTSVAHENVRQILADFITGLDAALAQALQQDYAAELKHRKKTPEAMAQLFSSLLFSLAVRARMGLSERALQQEAENLAATLR